MNHCPSPEQLGRLLAEELPAAEREAVAAHVESCGACQETLEGLTARSARDFDPPPPSACPGDGARAADKADGPLPGAELRFLDRLLAVALAADPAGPTSADTRTEEGAAASGTWPSLPGYEILGELGRGGMGIVYQARQTQLDRLVALKVILAGGHAGAADLVRFRTEGEAIARVQHPHIVQVFEVGAHDGLPFFSLELCAGGSLEKKLAGTPLPPQEAARLVETLARAMQAAHQAHVIHRDLKPANVLLTADGTPKITDFGLAKKLDEVGQTASGAILGTPSYMAPEQAGGKSTQVGPAADIYALGAILYECLTGRPPFKAATPLDTMMQVVQDEPVPPRQLQSGVPADLETICLKCLAKEPNRRYASASALADDLRCYLAGEPVQARPAGHLERTFKWARRRPALAGLLGVTLLALVSLAVLSGYLVVARSDADEKRKDAERAAEKATKASDFLVSIFELSDANGQRGTMTARQILDDAEKRIPRDFADQPELRAELLGKIETIYAKVTEKAPLAMILEVRGTVRLQSTRDPTYRAVPQTLLYSGDRLSLAADAQMQLVILSDLHKERLRPGTEVTVRRKGCEPTDAVRERDQDILMTFVRLPKGTFYMGWCGPGTKGKLTEIKEDFEIAVHTVTQGQWQAVMGDNPSYFSRFGGGRNEVKDISDEELKLFPVESMSWDEAQEFIKKLNEKERGSGFVYRFPTNAEWEYACRGGATSEEECSYHFYFAKPTNDLSSDQANFNGLGPEGKAPRGKFLKRTTRVGAYPPNKLGLCDMHGNVYQWCAFLVPREDWEPLFRGGSWNSLGDGCRAADRTSSTFRGEDRSFRLARVPVR
jgi:formylglycine-generating enzyme required for sulfatase activity